MEKEIDPIEVIVKQSHLIELRTDGETLKNFVKEAIALLALRGTNAYMDRWFHEAAVAINNWERTTTNARP